MRVSVILLILQLGNFVEVSSSQSAPLGCGEPPILADGDITTSRQYENNERVEYRCQNLYTMEGERFKTCVNGEWTGQMRCLPPLGCGKPPILADGDITTVSKWTYANNERVEYRCQNLYTMEGGPFKTCVNSEWIGQIRCIQPCTVDGDLMRAHNIGFRHVGDKKLYAPHNDHMTFSCTRGRRHDGRLNMRQQCVDGVMHLPTCI